MLQTLQKHNLSEDVFQQILRFFQKISSLKIFVRPPLDGAYLFCKKTSPKYVQNFAQNMLLTEASPRKFLCGRFLNLGTFIMDNIWTLVKSLQKQSS